MMKVTYCLMNPYGEYHSKDYQLPNVNEEQAFIIANEILKKEIQNLEVIDYRVEKVKYLQ